MTLFDLAPTPAAEPEPKLSADRRRTLRQAEAIAKGSHPLALVFGSVVFPRHPMTKGHSYSAEDVKGDPYTCGSCRWRQVLSYHRRGYPKCLKYPASISAEQYERMKPIWASHAASTDVRAWWPACTDYEPGDPGLSPDAARCLPGGAG